MVSIESQYLNRSYLLICSTYDRLANKGTHRQTDTYVSEGKVDKHELLNTWRKQWPNYLRVSFKETSDLFLFADAKWKVRKKSTHHHIWASTNNLAGNSEENI